MNKNENLIDQYNNVEKAKFILDLFHRTSIHHALWFAEAVHQYGREKAYELLNVVYKQSYSIQLKRLSSFFGAEIDENNIPVVLAKMEDEKKKSLMEALSINWLANDGVWFQAIEKSKGMLDAKRCNDSAWANFSPFEAMSIKQFLNLEENPGIEGLKKALQYRMYAFINKQSIKNETDNSFDFFMNECRVQVARKRKGLDDYACKSAGIVEYSSFAETIDSRIKTECICCPPDQHPDNYFCAWRFIIKI